MRAAHKAKMDAAAVGALYQAADAGMTERVEAAIYFAQRSSYGIEKGITAAVIAEARRRLAAAVAS